MRALLAYANQLIRTHGPNCPLWVKIHPTLGAAPTPQSLLTLLKLTQPAYPDPPVPSKRTHNKGSDLDLPLVPSASCPTLVLPHVALHHRLRLLFLGNCE